MNKLDKLEQIVKLVLEQTLIPRNNLYKNIFNCYFCGMPLTAIENDIQVYGKDKEGNDTFYPMKQWTGESFCSNPKCPEKILMNFYKYGLKDDEL